MGAGRPARWETNGGPARWTGGPGGGGGGGPGGPGRRRGGGREGCESSGERRCGSEGRCGGGKDVAVSRGALWQAKEQSVPVTVTRRRAGESGNTTGLRKRGGKRKCSGVGAECGGEGKCVRNAAVRDGGGCGCGGEVAVVSGDGERQRGRSGEGAAEGAAVAKWRRCCCERRCSHCSGERATASWGVEAKVQRLRAEVLL
jgi:hypothetical protein